MLYLWCGSCSSPPHILLASFVVQEVCVSGDLAPFDEVSVSFRGPLNLYNIAWYEGTSDGTLKRTTSWMPRYVNSYIVYCRRIF